MIQKISCPPALNKSEFFSDKMIAEKEQLKRKVSMDVVIFLSFLIDLIDVI